MPKIYTRTGDKGETGLWGGRRVPKSHRRVRAYGEVDELNSVLGAVLAALPPSASFKPLRGALARIQAELFVLGAVLATPPEDKGRLTPPFDRGVPPEAAGRLEGEIDRMARDLKPISRFIMPGGSTAGAWLHLARTVCRRAEREVVTLRAEEEVPGSAVEYLNRLSDHLFTAARWVNAKLKRRETQWEGLE